MNNSIFNSSCGCAGERSNPTEICGCSEPTPVNRRGCGCEKLPWTTRSGCGCEKLPWTTRSGCGCGGSAPLSPRQGCGCSDNVPLSPRQGCGCGDNAPLSPRQGCGCEAETRSTSPCTCAEGASFDTCLSGRSLAMVYAPNQTFTALYDPRQGLCKGTVFCELDKPFWGSGR